MKTNAELRAAARAHLGGSIFGNGWLVGVVAVVIYAVLSSILSYIGIGLLFMGPVTVGLAAFFLAATRYGSVDIAHMTYAVKSGERFTHTLLVGLFTSLFTFLWTLVFIIPGIVKTYAYALAPYLAIERNDLDARGCLAESQRLMDGKKMKLFLLDFSFLGWYILGLLCCGIGICFVEPYHHAARAEFYCAIASAPVEDTTIEDADVSK